MPEAFPRVAVVVVSYNGTEVTLEALASLARMDYPAFDLVLVDNGSTDGVGETVASAFPRVEQIRLEVNEGSSAGYASGLAWGVELGYDYVLLLNNDIEVEPSMLREMVRLAESDPGIGCVGPKACYFERRDHLWSAGGKLRFRNAITHERGYGEPDRGQFDRDEEVDYVNGCAILIRRAAAQAAGAWDPVFHICVDDADFCTRVRRAGLRCAFASRAVLYHRVAFSVGPYGPARNFQFGRSTAIYVRRYARPWQWASYLAFTAAAFVAAYLRELPRGRQAAVVAKLKGLWAGLRMELPPSPAPVHREGGCKTSGGGLNTGTAPSRELPAGGG